MMNTNHSILDDDSKVIQQIDDGVVITKDILYSIMEKYGMHEHPYDSIGLYYGGVKPKEATWLIFEITDPNNQWVHVNDDNEQYEMLIRTRCLAVGIWDGNGWDGKPDYHLCCMLGKYSTFGPCSVDVNINSSRRIDKLSELHSYIKDVYLQRLSQSTANFLYR